MIEKVQTFFRLLFFQKKNNHLCFGMVGIGWHTNINMIAVAGFHKKHHYIKNEIGSTLLNTFSTTGISFHQSTNIFIAI